MRFLLEANQVFDNLLDAKSYLESQENVDYSDLNEKERIDFIYDVIDLMRNKKILKSNSDAVIDAIQDTQFGSLNQDVITYLNELDNNSKAKSSTIDLIKQLIMNGNINYQTDKVWLNNESLYDRPTSDIDYTIKILTLANKPELQKDYFDRKLTPKDFMNGDKIFNVAKIKDILDAHQVKEVETKISGEDLLKQVLNKEVIQLQDLRNYAKDLFKKEEKLNNDIISMIDSENFENNVNDKILNKVFTTDKDGNAKDKLNNSLKQLVSQMNDYKKSQEEKEKEKIKDTGQYILTNILKASGQEPNKKALINYIKDLFKNNNKYKIIADNLDNSHIFDDAINNVLKAKFQDTLLSDSKELVDNALYQSILKAL